MKFAHSYVSTLENEGFPSQWVRSAISYRQLKKCIKRVQSELLSLGLSPDVLNRFWLTEDGSLADGEGDGRLARVGFAYSLRGMCILLPLFRAWAISLLPLFFYASHKLVLIQNNRM